MALPVGTGVDCGLALPISMSGTSGSGSGVASPEGHADSVTVAPTASARPNMAGLRCNARVMRIARGEVDEK